MFKCQPTFNTGTLHKRPKPGQHVACAHSLAEIRPDAYVPGKFLPFEPDFGAVRRIDGPTKDMGSTEDGMVTFNLPGFNCSHVQGERPDSSAQEEDESKEDKGVCQNEKEEMNELIYVRTEIARQTSLLPQNGTTSVQEAFQIEHCGDGVEEKSNKMWKGEV